MSKLQFRLAYRTDAAGKYNPTAPLEGNEDNMFIDADLSSVEHAAPLADVVIDLSEKGCLMVVADGMGGMNAGEVASDIAIKTVSEYFDAQHMANKSFRDSRSRMSYMEDVVVAADAAIKADARVNKDHEGMGSTIIMAWLCDDEICLTWCGDSRAYLFRPECGFWQMSKDHSYVQGLVDDHKITLDEAFDHPYGNIITRSLGDPEKKAKADSVKFDIYKGDIFMLCSDGLSGVLRDKKTYFDGQRVDTDNLQDIIAANRATMAQCRDELFAAAERNDWYDNVTAILCEIVSGQPLPADLKAPVQAAPEPSSIPTEEPLSYTEAPNPLQSGNNMRSSSIRINKKRLPLIIAGIVLLLGAVGVLVWLVTKDSKPAPTNDNDYFTYCNDNPTIENYRAYVEKYPDGEFIALAQNWIDEWVKDSTEKAQKNNPSAAPNNPSTTDSGQSTTKPEKPAKSETKAETKLEQIASASKESVGTNERTIEEEIEERNKNNDNPFPPQPTSENEGGTDKKPGHPQLTLVQGGMTPAQGGMTPAQEGMTPAQGGKTPAQGNTAELEAYNTFANTVRPNMEDCKKYLRGFGPDINREHFETVAKRFSDLYYIQIYHCESLDEINSIINNHDKLMRELHLTGWSHFDVTRKEQALKKKKELEEKQL